MRERERERERERGREGREFRSTEPGCLTVEPMTQDPTVGGVGVGGLNMLALGRGPTETAFAQGPECGPSRPGAGGRRCGPRSRGGAREGRGTRPDLFLRPARDGERGRQLETDME